MLRGRSVVLRAIERDDLDALWGISNELETTARVSDQLPRPQSKAQLEATFDSQISEPSDDSVSFVIDVDGTVVGRCDLYSLDHLNRSCELGISLGEAHWGKGYGQDAVRVLVDYAFRFCNMNRVALRVLADDRRAVGAYKRVGFVEEGMLRQESWFDGAFRDSLAMSILRREWSQAEWFDADDGRR